MEYIKFVQSAGTHAFDVHAFEKVGIAFRIEDNHHLSIKVHLFVLCRCALASMDWLNASTHLNAAPRPATGASDVLGDKQFRQAGLTHPRRTQHQG